MRRSVSPRGHHALSSESRSLRCRWISILLIVRVTGKSWVRGAGQAWGANHGVWIGVSSLRANRRRGGNVPDFRKTYKVSLTERAATALPESSYEGYNDAANRVAEFARIQRRCVNSCEFSYTKATWSVC